MVVLFSLTSILLSFIAIYSYSYEVKLVVFGMAGASLAVAIAFFISSFIEKDYVIKKIPLRDSNGRFIKRK